MPLLKTVILPYIVKVVSSDNDCPLHLHLDDDTPQDPSPDGHVACEGALLVDVFTLSGITRRLESQTNISGVPYFLSWQFLLQIRRFAGDEDSRLLLVCFLGLY